MNAYPKNEHCITQIVNDKAITVHVSGNLIRFEIERMGQPKLTYQYYANVCPLKKNP